MTVNAMAEGKLTYVFKKGIISAPEFGAVTTNTSCHKAKCWRVIDVEHYSHEIEAILPSCRVI